MTAPRMTSNARSHDDYNVGWVCALAKEQTAATAMLDQRHADLPNPLHDQNTYTLGSIGNHNVVIACLPKGKPGTNSAAAVAAQMASTFPSIKFGLMVGIGGGVPPKVRLGDVVVSTPTGQYPGVVQYDLGKAEDGGNFERTGSLNNPPRSLLTALTKLETAHDLEGSRISEYLEELEVRYPRLAPKYLRPDSMEDVLFKSDYNHATKGETNAAATQDDDDEDEEESCQYCDRAQVVKRKPRELQESRVHYGLIASGNQIVNDAIFRNKLSKDLGRNLLCVETEAAGLMDNFPCIVIRGICDYSDSHKNKNWQEYAAAVAAAFAKELLEHVQPCDVAQERPAKDQLTKQIAQGVHDFRKTLNSYEVQKILDWLTPIDYGPQHSDYLQRRQKGTGQWLLESEEYQNWLEMPQTTLFCPGNPGAGKTILTSIVINDVESRFRGDENVGIAYIYCNFRRKDEQTIGNMISSIVKQLGQSQLSLPRSIKDLYERHKVKLTRPSLDEISIALQSLAALYSRVFIIVDALDECQTSNGHRAKFLSEIFNLQKEQRTNFLATSRFIPEITERFRGSTSLEIRASKNDVKRYLEGHLGRLPSFVSRDPDLQKEITVTISESVDGMFLLAQIYLDSLDDKLTKAALINALKELQKQGRNSGENEKTEMLAHAYEQAMERVNGQRKGFRDVAIRTLSWITCAKRPLRTLELQYALGVEIGKAELNKNNLPEIEDVVSTCAGLVTVDEESEIIRLVHYTTQAYFEQNLGSLFPNAQSDITLTCATYLSFRIFESGRAQSDEEFEARLQSNPLYDYAARNWGYHAYDISGCQNTELFLKQQAVVEAASQALFAIKRSKWHSKFSQEPPRQMTGLHLAAHFGLEEAVKTLCNVYIVDIREEYGRTPLSYAAESGHEAIVQLLLEKGAEIDGKNKHGRTPLSYAAGSGHEVIVQLLLEKGAEFDAEDEYGRTSLSYAAENGHEVIGQLLLEKGAEIDGKNKHGRTPLSYAAERGHEVIVQLLLEKGAEFDAEDEYSRTPLSCASENGHEAIVQLLLEKDAEVNVKDKRGMTLLSYAAQRGHEAIVRLLLEKGAEVDAKDGRSPLSYAVESGYETIVHLLLEKGAEVDAKDECGMTPLSYAANSRNEAAVRLLLEKGAKVDVKNVNN